MSEHSDLLVRKLAELPVAALDAIDATLTGGVPICVGSWGVDGVKQSYTCVMGAAACVMAGIPVAEFVTSYKKYGDIESTAIQVVFGESSDEEYDAATNGVPGAFDEWATYSDGPALIMPTAGGTEEGKILNGRGRRELAALVTEARSLVTA